MMVVQLEMVGKSFQESAYRKFLGLELDGVQKGHAKLKLTFINVESGVIKSEGSVLQSRSTALVEAKLFDENESLFAHCTSTFKTYKEDSA